MRFLKRLLTFPVLRSALLSQSLQDLLLLTAPSDAAARAGALMPWCLKKAYDATRHGRRARLHALLKASLHVYS